MTLIIDEIPIIIDIIKKSKEKIDDNFNNSLGSRGFDFPASRFTCWKHGRLGRAHNVIAPFDREIASLSSLRSWAPVGRSVRLAQRNRGR